MNEDSKAKLDTLMDLISSINNIRVMSDEAGKLYSSLLVFDVEKIEKTLVESFAHGESALANMEEEAKKRLYDKAALLGCLVRFKLDLEQRTTIAKEVKAKYDKMMTT
jgi:hypothetical protein